MLLTWITPFELFLHTLPLGFRARKGLGIENVYRIDTLASPRVRPNPLPLLGLGRDSEIIVRKVRVTHLSEAARIVRLTWVPDLPRWYD